LLTKAWLPLGGVPALPALSLQLFHQDTVLVRGEAHRLGHVRRDGQAQEAQPGRCPQDALKGRGQRASGLSFTIWLRCIWDFRIGQSFYGPLPMIAA